MIMIQFIDARTNENMTELGSREWPTVPSTGDQLVCGTRILRFDGFRGLRRLVRGPVGFGA